MSAKASTERCLGRTRDYVILIPMPRVRRRVWSAFVRTASVGIAVAASGCGSSDGAAFLSRRNAGGSAGAGGTAAGGAAGSNTGGSAPGGAGAIGLGGAGGVAAGGASPGGSGGAGGQLGVGGLAGSGGAQGTGGGVTVCPGGLGAVESVRI